MRSPGSRAHVHLSILNEAVDVPSGKRSYVPVDGVDERVDAADRRRHQP